MKEEGIVPEKESEEAFPEPETPKNTAKDAVKTYFRT